MLQTRLHVCAAAKCWARKIYTGFSGLNGSCRRSPGVHTTRPMWTQNLTMTDQAAWLELPVLEPGFPG